jgi:Zinc finger, C3HC4 type (RING finger)
MNRKYQCLGCKKLDAARLPCSHDYCKECMEKCLDLKDLSVDDFECPNCSQVVYFEFIIAFYLTHEEFSDTFARLKTCTFCNKYSEKIKRLDCNHRVCVLCFEDLIYSKDVKYITDIACKVCRCYISQGLYKDTISKERMEQIKALKSVVSPIKFFCANCRSVNSSKNLKCENCKFSVPKELKKDDDEEPNMNRNKSAVRPIKKLQIENQPPKIVQNPEICIMCRIRSGKAYNCDHRYCTRCFSIHVKNFIKENPFDNTKCLECNSFFPEISVIECFGSKAIYLNEKQKIVDMLYGINEAVFFCGICAERFKVSDSITLECDHRYCSSCLGAYFEERIMSSNVSEDKLICPECPKPVAYDIIKGVVPKKLFDKYLEFGLRNWEPDEGSIKKICFKCEKETEIDKDLQWFKCPYCNSSYCPQCNQNHNYKISCEEYNLNKLKPQNPTFSPKKVNFEPNNINGAEKPPKPKKNSIFKKNKKPDINQKEEKKSKKNEEDLSIAFLQKNFKKCPKCKMAIEKESGCNFIMCRWPTCKETYFCILCDKLLTVIYN